VASRGLGSKLYSKAEGLEKRGVEGTYCLPYSLKVVMPYGCPGCFKAMEELVDDFTKLFHGTTVYTAEGTWEDSKGAIITDHNKVIEVYHKCMTHEDEERAVEYIAKAAEAANQDSMALGFGKYMIVPTKRLRELK